MGKNKDKSNKAEAPAEVVDTKGKKNKAPKGDAAEKPAKEKKDKSPEFKYGVSDLAELLGVQGPSVRVQLRNKGIEKAGKSYGWNTKGELEAVAKQIKADVKDPAPKGEGKSKKDKAPKDAPADEAPAEGKKKDKKNKKNKG